MLFLDDNEANLAGARAVGMRTVLVRSIDDSRAGLAAAGVGAALYAANCTDDSPLFVGIWYPLAVAIVAASGAAIGRRWLAW